ncbi:hypothetical protein [Tenacibaculum holothuriorum]|uniref:hypothetical protein n=1 Tax=Tenacibaculum holothuriorum TaxID=1635173 RepID=UPI001302D9FE|nr:hypothetical protein [Tenacibaculum holothuriorum]
MKTSLILKFIPLLFGSTLSINEGDPLYILIVAVLTALFNYFAAKKKQKEEKEEK